MKETALPLLEGILFLYLLISACGPDLQETAPAPGADQPIPELVVSMPTGRIRQQPRPDGPIIRQLEKGTPLIDLGEVSPHTTVISFGSRKYDEPWLQVEDPEGLTGWIFAGEVAPAATDSLLERFREEKQLQSIFGRAGRQQLRTFQRAWEQAGTDAEVANLYKQGLALRDTLNALLEQRSSNYGGEALPDLFWIDRYLPGYVVQVVAEGTAYYLFNDYGQWLDLARQTKGRQAEQFVDLMIRCFPQDSVEYFYPAWELQTWDYGGHHLLGRGIARDILARLAVIRSGTPLFAEPLNRVKDQIVTGITQANVHFWEPDSLVKQELDTIIQANWSIFTPTDRIALNTRRTQLDSAAVYGIRFNARAGE